MENQAKETCYYLEKPLKAKKKNVPKMQDKKRELYNEKEKAFDVQVCACA